MTVYMNFLLLLNLTGSEFTSTFLLKKIKEDSLSGSVLVVLQFTYNHTFTYITLIIFIPSDGNSRLSILYSWGGK